MFRPTAKSGFTLVEMIVSLAVFSIVAVVALGALTKIVSANRKAQTLQTSITNLNFALDAMSRELRTGREYVCEENNGGNLGYEGDDLEANPCPGGFASNDQTDAILAFRSSKKLTTGTNAPCAAAFAYRFKLDDDKYVLEKAVQTECGTGIEDSDFKPLLDQNLMISGYYMRVDTSGDYPLLTLRISGYAGLKEREKTYFNIQTSVAPHVN